LNKKRQVYPAFFYACYHQAGLSPSWVITKLGYHQALLSPNGVITKRCYHQAGLSPSGVITKRDYFTKKGDSYAALFYKL
jgi:hypothetical protein